MILCKLSSCFIFILLIIHGLIVLQGTGEALYLEENEEEEEEDGEPRSWRR